MKAKIFFALEAGAHPSFETESMWAEAVGSGYKLLNTPFYAFGVSAEDVVSATEVGGILMFKAVLSRGGHSSYRLYLQGNATIGSTEFKRLWKPMERLGATYESANDNFLAVDIPPSADIAKIYRLIEKGKARGIWAFDEVHYAGAG